MKIFIFLLAFIISYGMAFISIYTGRKFKILDHPDNKRKIHKNSVPRTGGLGMFLSFFLMYFIFRNFFPFDYILLILFLVFLVGFIEDIFHIRFRWRLFLLFLIFISLYPLHLFITDFGLFSLPKFFAFLFIIFCIVGIVNAYNFVDGINGLSSFLGVISSFFIFLTALYYNDLKLANFVLIGIGAIFGFFIRNFLKGDIFMGDSGSYFIGSFIGISALLLLNRNPQISPWAVLLFSFIPVFETLFSMYRRKKVKKSIFKPDRLHLHHRLLKRYNKNEKKVVFVISFIQVLIGMIAFLFKTNLPILILFTFLSIMLLKRIWYRKLTFSLGKKIFFIV